MKCPHCQELIESPAVRAVYNAAVFGRPIRSLANIYMKRTKCSYAAARRAIQRMAKKKLLECSSPGYYWST